MKFYLSGPITGIDPWEVCYQFHGAEADVNRHGHESINPTDIMEWNLSWESYMRIALTTIVESGEVDCMIMLPGWEESNGATIEHMYAEANGIPIAYRLPSGKYRLRR